MNELFSFCDDHFKIFIIIWLKLREYYLESKNKQISLPFIIKKTLNFLKKIRKQCTEIKRFRKIAKFVYFLEIELVESDKFIDKLQHFAILAEVFDLPEPITNILNNLGINSNDDNENNLFTKKINDLFKDIDNIDKIGLEKKINIIDDSLQEEGTLLNFLKNKSNNQLEQKITKISTEPVVYNSPIQTNNIYSFKSTNINRIPRFSATPNPRTIYRHH
jgi:hypothetical protein